MVGSGEAIVIAVTAVITVIAVSTWARSERRAEPRGLPNQASIVPAPLLGRARSGPPSSL